MVCKLGEECEGEWKPTLVGYERVWIEWDYGLDGWEWIVGFRSLGLSVWVRIRLK